MSKQAKAFEFPFMIPSDWCNRMECDSKRRFVAFYWSGANDQIVWNDGRDEGVSERATSDWLAFMRRTQIELFMCNEQSHFGFCDSNATHWLLHDRQELKAYAIPVSLVNKILPSQSLRNVKIGSRSAAQRLPVAV